MGEDNKDSTKNCTFGGTDDKRFAEPMLWIGLYVVGASIVCMAAIVADLIRSKTWSKRWISPKFLVLNAAMLTILGVATKIPSDINGAMPGVLDQLAKLTGILLICVAMTHAMPSLGVMDNWELLSNMVALGILVISTAVNIWFQIHTTLIIQYAFSNIMYTIIMLFIFSVLVSHSLSVATIKQQLEKQYRSKDREIRREVEHQFLSEEKLEGYVKKYWLMALTSSPDFVLLTSRMSLACANLYYCLFFSSVPVLLDAVAIGRKGCYVDSAYRWSAGLIFSIQIPAVIAGVISAFLRAYNARGPEDDLPNYKMLLNVEKYRMHQLEMWMEYPLPFHVRNETVRSALYHAKNMGVNILILFQRSMIFLTKLIVLFFEYLAILLIMIILVPLILLSSKKESSNPQSSPRNREDLSSYVLWSEGETEGELNNIAHKWKDLPDRWIETGKARSPDYLLELIKKSYSSSSFDEVSSRVLRTTSIRRSRTVTSEVLGDCWSLHLATLMCIIYAVFYGTAQDGANVKSLMKALDQGFLYLVLVDANKDMPSNKVAIDAAKMVWANLQIRRKWLKVGLDRLYDGKDFIKKDFLDTIQNLEGLAKLHAVEHQKEDLLDELSLETIAAKSMSRITGALLDCDKSFTFEELEADAAGVVESCLADLSVAILRECSNGSYGSREEHVRLAAQVLGETEEIRKSLEARRGASGP